MKIHFEKLFEILLFHNYYKSKISKDFDILPTDACKTQLRNYGLIYRQTSTGLVVLYEVTENGDETTQPLKPIVDDVKFSFMLMSKNPYLINYSQLPLKSQPKQIYYMHNLNNNKQDGKLLVTGDTNISFISNKDRILLRPQFFYYNLESPESDVSVQIINEIGDIMLQETANIIEGVLNYPVNLRHYSPGKFILKIADEPDLVIYASDELIRESAFGLIEIFRNKNVPADYQFVKDDGDVKFKTYTVQIDQRKTFWKYYVTIKYRLDIDPKNLSIEPSMSFLKQDVQVLPGDINVVPFISKNEMPLQEAPVKGIKLKSTNGNGGKSIEIENLVNPSIEMITPNPEDNKIYSEVFIYI